MNAVSKTVLGRRGVNTSVGSETYRGAAEAKVIAANIAFYHYMAEKYDTYEKYILDLTLQQSVEKDLDRIGAYFEGRSPRCLECGGGTGNLTLKMCERGWPVTVVDVSENMLGLLQAKARARGFSPTLIRGPIERFLESSRETYEVVAFSSVLHHLYSYPSVVERATLHVCPGGLFYSNLDPVVSRVSLLARYFDSVDIALAKLSFDPADVLPGIGRRLRKLFARPDVLFNRPVVSPGDIAEYHAKSGVDDLQIITQLRKAGFVILDHVRYPSGRTPIGLWLNKRIRAVELFKIIAQREPLKT